MKLKPVFLFFILISFTAAAADKESERFYIAGRAFDDGFYEASASLFERFIEQFDESEFLPEAKLYLAKCYYFQQDYPRALDILNDIDTAEKYDFSAEVNCWMAEIYFKGGDYARSLKYVNKVISNYPKSGSIGWAYYLAGDNNWQMHDYAQAKDYFLKMTESGGGEEIIDNSYARLLEIYFQDNDFSRLLDSCLSYLKKYPSGVLRPKVYFYQAQAYYAQENYKQALECYYRSLELDAASPVRDLAYRGIVLSYLAENERERARENIDKIQSGPLRLLSEGNYYFEAKDYIRALEIFDSFIDKFQKSEFITDVYLHKADTLYEMGRINDSLSVYSYILDNFKKDKNGDVLDKAHYGLAWCYLKNGEFKKAIEEFQDSLKYTDSPVVKLSSQIQIADAYQEAKEYGRALEIYEKILKVNPNTIYADYIQFQIGMVFLKQKQFADSLMALKNLKKNFPLSKLAPQAQYYLAVGYFSSQQYEEAGVLLEDFIQKFKEHDLLASAYYLYGKCFFNQSEYESALNVFLEMMGLFKSRRLTDKEIERLLRIDLGNVYLNMSLFDRAKKVWQDFLARFGDSEYAASVSLYLGGLCEQQGDYSEAQGYYRSILDKFGRSVWANEALLSLGHLCWTKNDLPAAKEYFLRLIERQVPLSLKAKFYLAKVYRAEGGIRDALSLYDQIIDSASSLSGFALLEKGHIYMEQQDYGSAVDYFTRAMDYGLDSEELRLSLGSCLEKNNHIDDAVKQYLGLVYTFESVPHKVKAYFRLARIYEKEGKLDLAAKMYKEIINLEAQESKIARQKLEKLKK